MVDVKTEHGTFNYADDFAAAGMVVLRALVRGASSTPVVVSEEGHDVTRLAVEYAVERISQAGGRTQPRSAPLHLQPPFERRVLARRLAQRADWETAQQQREWLRRTEWRKLDTAGRIYLEQTDDG